MLTDTACRHAKPRASRYRLTDADGLLLEVMPSGSRHWRYRYRMHGRRRDLTIGPYPAVTLAEARRIRDRHRAAIAEGRDPIDEGRDRAERRERETVSAVAGRWFALDRHADKSRREYRARLDHDILPALGARHVAEVRASDVLAVLERARRRGLAGSTVRGVLSTASAVFAHALAERLVEANPAAGLRATIDASGSNHRAAIVEPVAFGALLRAIEDSTSTPTVVNAVRLAARVPLRSEELRTLEWAHVDVDVAVLRLPPGHGKGTAATRGAARARLVPLSRQAVELLEGQREAAGASRWVFPSPYRRGGETRPISDFAPRHLLAELGYAGTHSFHGFRSSFRTLADERLGERWDLLERALGHAVGSSVERSYSRGEHIEQLRVLLQRWADYLDRLRAGTGALDTVVVPLRRQA